jgi:hypothetical protein
MPRVSTVTISCVGRDFDSRLSSTSDSRIEGVVVPIYGEICPDKLSGGLNLLKHGARDSQHFSDVIRGVRYGDDSRMCWFEIDTVR